MKQITVITAPNQPGTLADLADALAKQQINILDMEVLDDHTHAVIILHAEPHDLALRVLSDAGFHAVSDDLLVIRIEDQPGGVARIAARFREPALNIRSMRIARRDHGWATVILSTDDNERARELLGDCLAEGGRPSADL